MAQNHGLTLQYLVVKSFRPSLWYLEKIGRMATAVCFWHTPESRDFAWQEFPLQTSCEAVACKTVLNNHQSLIIISIYRPPNSYSQYFESIYSLVHDITLENPKSIVWIGGDFIYPISTGLITLFCLPSIPL